ncbi:hypothetical protein D3C87_1199650 [compost metagenome]
MTDDDRAATPGRQKIGDENAPVPVEIIRRFVEDQEVGSGVDLSRKCGPRALPAGQRRKRCGGQGIQPDLRQGPGNFVLQHPVDIFKLFETGRSRLRTGKDIKRIARAKQVGDGLFGHDLHALAQKIDAARDGNRARGWRQFLRNQFQKRRLADAVAPDKAGAFRSEAKIDVGKERMTVRC